eukprot:1196263-Prorocentrum_minimum.AAC.4
MEATQHKGRQRALYAGRQWKGGCLQKQVFMSPNHNKTMRVLGVWDPTITGRETPVARPLAAADRQASDRQASDCQASDRQAADRTVADRTTADRTTADRTTADCTAADRTTADRTTADRTTADRTTADRQAADCSTSADRIPAQHTTL